MQISEHSYAILGLKTWRTRALSRAATGSW